jgi:hypothetical protein
VCGRGNGGVTGAVAKGFGGARFGGGSRVRVAEGLIHW